MTDTTKSSSRKIALLCFLKIKFIPEIKLLDRPIFFFLEIIIFFLNPSTPEIYFLTLATSFLSSKSLYESWKKYIKVFLDSLFFSRELIKF